jgi:hypothetical protein
MQVVSIVVACRVSDVPLRVLLPRAWCWWDVTPTHLSVGTWAGTVAVPHDVKAPTARADRASHWLRLFLTSLTVKAISTKTVRTCWVYIHHHEQLS